MCGIAGIILAGGEGKSQENLLADNTTDQMLARLRHRGPDDQGITNLESGMGHLSMAHTRLSILDLTAAGHQPMHDPETGNTITFNGEIYTFRELRAGLGEGR